jgi:hypothetical protein
MNKNVSLILPENTKSATAAAGGTRRKTIMPFLPAPIPVRRGTYSTEK